MTLEEYLRNPCAASSLPWWKSQAVAVPEGMRIFHDTDPRPRSDPFWRDEPYFRLLHSLRSVPSFSPPEGYALGGLSLPEAAAHVRLCYQDPSFREEELLSSLCGAVFAPDLALALRETGSGQIAASAVATADPESGEASIEWVQVSPGARRKGLGRAIVAALLRALRGRADFATVSGRILAPERPERLYRACGFTGRDVWHVCTKR